MPKHVPKSDRHPGPHLQLLQRQEEEAETWFHVTFHENDEDPFHGGVFDDTLDVDRSSGEENKMSDDVVHAIVKAHCMHLGAYYNDDPRNESPATGGVLPDDNRIHENRNFGTNGGLSRHSNTCLVAQGI